MDIKKMDESRTSKIKDVLENIAAFLPPKDYLQFQQTSTLHYHAIPCLEREIFRINQLHNDPMNLNKSIRHFFNNCKLQKQPWSFGHLVTKKTLDALINYVKNKKEITEEYDAEDSYVTLFAVINYCINNFSKRSFLQNVLKYLRPRVAAPALLLASLTPCLLLLRLFKPAWFKASVNLLIINEPIQTKYTTSLWQRFPSLFWESLHRLTIPSEQIEGCMDLINFETNKEIADQEIINNIKISLANNQVIENPHLKQARLHPAFFEIKDHIDLALYEEDKYKKYRSKRQQLAYLMGISIILGLLATIVTTMMPNVCYLLVASTLLFALSTIDCCWSWYSILTNDRIDQYKLHLNLLLENKINTESTISSITLMNVVREKLQQNLPPTSSALDEKNESLTLTRWKELRKKTSHTTINTALLERSFVTTQSSQPSINQIAEDDASLPLLQIVIH